MSNVDNSGSKMTGWSRASQPEAKTSVSREDLLSILIDSKRIVLLNILPAALYICSADSFIYIYLQAKL
ncbi:hypothetical protein BJY00DRAFT_282504, partial [Aspergillus carlsbadensis]